MLSFPPERSRVPIVRLELDGPICPERVPCATSIGVYDGFHRGHAALIATTVADARRRGIRAVAVTFDPDPDCIVRQRPALRLMSTDDRVAALGSSGVDLVAVVPFTSEVAALDHEGFFSRVLGRALDVRAVHVGADFRLGAGNASNVERMRSWGAGRGIDVQGHELVRDGCEPITATRIRSLLSQGDFARATEELGHGYMVRGIVRSGRGEGTGMGFPTANVEVGEGVQIPADGVYAGFVLVDGSAWPAAVNVGLPPTFESDPSSARMEASLLGFSGDLYGREVAVLFLERIRPSRKFEDLSELTATVKRDIVHVEEVYGRVPRRCSRDNGRG